MKTKRVDFRCPIQLLEEFDAATNGRYGGRTDAILEAMRDILQKLKQGPSDMRLIVDIISEMTSGKPQSSIPVIYVDQDFLTSTENRDSTLNKELDLCRRYKVKVIVHYADGLSPHELAVAEKLLADIPLYTPIGEPGKEEA